MESGTNLQSKSVHHSDATEQGLTLGAQITEEGVRFRCWAPKPASVEVVLEPQGTARALTRDSDGYWTGLVAEATAGMRYRYRLDDGQQAYPDPCSRFQPEGPHGPSLIVDPAA